MATVLPFPAVRPKPELAPQICELPYDVMSTAEARTMAADNPRSFLRVSRAELEFPDGTDPYSPAIYERAAANFRKLLSAGDLIQDGKPCYYLYRQQMGSHTQTGIVGVFSCEEYRKNIVKKHEFTRPDKEDDRVRHIEALDSQTGPVFLTYPATEKLSQLQAQIASGTPVVSLTAPDGIIHTAWVIDEDEKQEFIRAQFEAIPFLYIADGHHRSAAANRVDLARKGAGDSGKFLAVVFPHDELQILAYNRAVKDLNGLTILDTVKRLSELGKVMVSEQKIPAHKHQVCFYIQSQWHTLDWWPALLEREKNAIDLLDVSLLQNFVLSPIFNIQDPRTDKRISFVGGIRGPEELEKLVNKGEYMIAFSMYPTSIVDLMQIADQDGIMPPKSTWFEPKLRDGMFCHMI